MNRNAQSDRLTVLIFIPCSIVYEVWVTSLNLSQVTHITKWVICLHDEPFFCFKASNEASWMASNMVFSPTITLSRFLFPRDQCPDISNMHLGSPTHYWPYCQLGHSLPFLTHLPLLSYTETCIWAPVKWTCSVSHQLAWHFLTLMLFSL